MKVLWPCFLRFCTFTFYYLMHVLMSDIVLLLPFLDLFNIYNFCVKLFNNDQEYNE